jgi:diguanylate cyclase (GGDEF)-like protein/PAS domain S-box-containing protein
MNGVEGAGPADGFALAPGPGFGPASGSRASASVTEIIVASLLATSLDYEATLVELVHAVVPAMADWCAIEMVEPDGSLRKVAIAHVDPALERMAVERAHGWVRTAQDKGMVPRVVRTGIPRLVAEVDEELVRRTAGGPDHVRLLLELGLSSLMIVPLQARGRTLGALSFASADSGRVFDEVSLADAQDIASRAALIVDNARLYTDLRHVEEELRQSRDQLEVILGGIADGIVVQDSERQLVYANDAAARTLGFKDAQALVADGLETAREGYELLDEDGNPLDLDDLPGRHALRGAPAPERVLRNRAVETGEERWAIARSRPVFGERDEVRLAINIFTDITALKQTEQDRAELLARVGADPLTGLLNHRVFHERLAVEVSRARRHDHRLSLALIDVDNFKQINDTSGHQAGDRVLAAVAERLAEVARTEDVLARIGGDEFALLLPYSGEAEAYAAVERARSAVSSTPLLEDRRVTVSAGICDFATAHDADSMFRFADGALYWSKAHGRDVAWIYDPATIRQLSAQERAEHLQQSQTLIGIRALARAIDAKDPNTRQHADRVAALAARMAGVLGWGFDRVSLLSEAALVHDVGKLGVPDAVLLKPDLLTAEEYELTKLHAGLSAQIVEDVLRPEQVAWIRAHHERPDGHGYPDGLVESEIPLGAALLTLADVWDVMTVSRSYGTRKTYDQALEECRSLVGRQFTADALEALEELHRRGLLTSASAGPTPR